MNNSIINYFIMTIVLCFGVELHAQKYEINAFEKQNKEMLKQLKKEYGTSPKVELTDDGSFYLVLAKKDGKKGSTRFLLMNDTGATLCSDWLDDYKAIKGGNFFVGINGESKKKWGVVSIKGKQLLPIQFDNIEHNNASEAGTFETKSSNTYWHPSNKEVWISIDGSHYTFYSADCSNVINEFEGKMVKQLSYFYNISPTSMSSNDNQKGLLTLDGSEIFPQEYNRFYIESSGFVNCYKKDPDGMSRCGGKMLDSSISDLLVPSLFLDVTYNNATKKIECKIHRDDEYEVYDPLKNYEVTFKDKGEKLYDMGNYQDVITYYEGEGYGTIWGDYYMGLSAEKIAKVEMDKMNNVINTLNSSTNYYLPINNPEKYKFDAGTISGMYTSAGIYLEKYINNPKVSQDDPTLLKARKLRGEIITARNNVTRKIEEYGTALQSATSRNIERERKIAEQKLLQAQKEAEAQRAAQQLGKAIGNLFK